jgi:hypothetical protein
MNDDEYFEVDYDKLVAKYTMALNLNDTIKEYIK